jgi:hypothetical protein
MEMVRNFKTPSPKFNAVTVCIYVTNFSQNKPHIRCYEYVGGNVRFVQDSCTQEFYLGK